MAVRCTFDEWTKPHRWNHLRQKIARSLPILRPRQPNAAPHRDRDVELECFMAHGITIDQKPKATISEIAVQASKLSSAAEFTISPLTPAPVLRQMTELID